MSSLYISVHRYNVWPVLSPKITYINTLYLSCKKNVNFIFFLAYFVSVFGTSIYCLRRGSKIPVPWSTSPPNICSVHFCWWQIISVYNQNILVNYIWQSSFVMNLKIWTIYFDFKGLVFFTFYYKSDSIYVLVLCFILLIVLYGNLSFNDLKWP